ncbi:hypothetical protein J5X98_19000 [Leptothermofonsia sichuanensis E412]|uniref:hypothetical protein n=1 Tax=Leptothermofonsia sichuanensis TaxID=2917832 RepID=UPI001CA6691B|nr:hypothetical protein [Leptothermofonsia sichuanensis]QZZ19440.1 hypothetical protein J5X98_19000 [Leptothermofonsia sichuanensis E412]
MRTELVWEGTYDEYDHRREVDIAGCAMPFASAFRLRLQKIESIDEPRRAAATGRGRYLNSRIPVWMIFAIG